MASKAKRHRKKLEREGKLNPKCNRGDWNGIKPVTRTTPTKAEATRKQVRKHKPNFSKYNGGDSAYFIAG
ncbi:hypothetical protein [Bacillus sp. 165]|uniref:hypothetical protein n=1 Tax=Bacillus sp. 165 TaxID=1529117 RepID=UPI001ADACF61|nr:hypothetical protein [Bacillus sp. 165]MBO9129215.1 hypothetical protein [Bacillus sp. 165]